MPKEPPDYRPMAVGDMVMSHHPVLGLITGEITTIHHDASGQLWVRIHTGLTAVRVRADKLIPLPDSDSS